MDEQNSGFILCDISFNGQLIADVKLPKACSMGNIVQGLWLDDNFRKNGLAYLKAKDEEAEKKDSEVSTVSLKCIRGIDRCILRAYVAIRIMPAWKWLEFKDFIVDFENKKDCYTVGDVLGSLCTGLHKPVLRIVPKSDNEADDQEVKNIVNELLKTRSLATLAAAECPLSTGMLSLIAQGKYTSTISHDKCLAFIRWLRRQDLTNDVTNSEQEKVETLKPKLPALTPPTPSKYMKPRITFSPNEIEKLTQWFEEEERPSKEVMQKYTEVLNVPRKAASIRLLSPESIFFWFKNKRSKKKREESSLLEPWEKGGEGGSGEGSQGTPLHDTPVETEENGIQPSMVVTRDSKAQQAQSTMIVSYASHDGTKVNFTQSSPKPRKIPKSRTTFDPNTELSNLNIWFCDNERPGKEIIQEYTNILNVERMKKSKRMLSSDSIAMWFKNQRSKRRRIEGSFDSSSDNEKPQVCTPVKEDDNKVSPNDESPTDATPVTPVTSVPAKAIASCAPEKEMPENGKEEDLERNVYAAGLVSVKADAV